MARKNKQFICQSCGSIFSKWIGKCENCNEWNTLLEDYVNKSHGPLSKSFGQKLNFEYLDSDNIEYSRLQTNLKEVDRVTGGGFV